MASGDERSGSEQEDLFSDDENGRRSDHGSPKRDSQTARLGPINTDDEEEEERKKEEKRKKDEEKKKNAKPKGPVRRQMISEDMLTGKNGVTKLPKLFEDFKFRGKGREKQDLSEILSKLEYWVHLLHPKQPFDQSLQRIEFLGLKRKILKTHLKRIRMGMCEEGPEDLVPEEHLNDMDDEEFAELQESVDQAGSSTSQAVESASASAPEVLNEIHRLVPASKSNGTVNDNNDFPDDDDMEDLMNTNQNHKDKENESSVQEANPNELDADMESDVENVDMDDYDDIFQKEVELAMKRAELAEAEVQSKHQNDVPLPVQEEVS